MVRKSNCICIIYVTEMWETILNLGKGHWIGSLELRSFIDSHIEQIYYIEEQIEIIC